MLFPLKAAVPEGVLGAAGPPTPASLVGWGWGSDRGVPGSLASRGMVHSIDQQNYKFEALGELGIL